MKIVDYFKECYTELTEKVSWPTWKELRSSVIVVSIASLIIALVVSGKGSRSRRGLRIRGPRGR